MIPHTIARNYSTTASNALLRRYITTINTNSSTKSIQRQATLPVPGPLSSYGLSQTVSHRRHRLYKFSTATVSVDSHHTNGNYSQNQKQPFPSLLLGANNSIIASGSFAETQKVFLQPDLQSVQTIVDLLRTTKTGIVAHYYMDVELQGVLQAVKQYLPNQIGIADSLKMGDMAVDMVSSSTDDVPACQQIICLGVDFMSESVAAILQRNGYDHIPVYRAARASIGCSLAESAETDTYRAWLQTEHDSTKDRPLLHVVYINTSLETKAISNSIVPTITCTSSNVLQTILNAAIQVPNVKILYGPDTYMGENLITFLTVLEQSWSTEKIQKELHPLHTKETIRQVRDSIVVYPSGNCIVHHMFGTNVVNTVKEYYTDAYVTAHLEVPGEMFEIAMNKSLYDNGVCGSTSDILKFISRKVHEVASSPEQQQDQKQRLQFILGTEAGMVTSIVSSVQSILHETGNTNISAEIIFPVASEAVMATNEEDNHSTGMTVVPGVAGGDGCSTAGGCATCPFMKMNNLDAVLDVLEHIQKLQQSGSSPTNSSTSNSELILRGHLPPDRIQGKRINGISATDLGTEPIVYMREFNRTKTIPKELIERVMR